MGLVLSQIYESPDFLQTVPNFVHPIPLKPEACKVGVHQQERLFTQFGDLSLVS